MSDPRFARLKSDPRFRRPKTKQNKVVVDERFKSVFEKPKKKSGRKVDKYGRALLDTHDQENLKRYYRLENGNVEDQEAEAVPRKPDLARGEVLLESSDEDEDVTKQNGSDSDSDDGGFVTLGAGDSFREEDLEIDLDEDNFADLDAQAEDYLKAQQGEDEEQEQLTTAECTRRLAVVNLDWDHVRANHLYKICSSLVSSSASALLASSSTGQAYNRKKGSSKGSRGGAVNVARGRVLSVRVYPSDFGKERMAREDKEGPPPEIFKKQRQLKEEEINEKTVFEVGNEEEYDEDALRKYQLERLRYYYAIVECDTAATASHIYNELEATELERSANVFDTSFVPDDMSFDNEPRDEVSDDLNTNYKPVEFVTDALRHSKVKLTWDDDDPERHQVTRRALTKKEIEENDFRAYIANTSSESEGELDHTAEKAIGPSSSREERKARKKKEKKESRDKLRALLLEGNEDDIPEGWGDTGGDADVDMEITFTPGLSAQKNPEDETTLEKYQRKMKEKRKKRKEEGKGKEKEDVGQKSRKVQVDDEFFEDGEQLGEEEDELEDEATKRSKVKKGRVKDSSARPIVEERPQATTQELELLVAPDNPTDEPKHFNIKSVIKAEKKKRHKSKKGKGKVEEDQEAQQEFQVNVKDERFKALFEDHQFAIDPTNPHFKKTKAMSAFMDERQRRRREQVGEDDSAPPRKMAANSDGGSKSLQNLVESVKRKAAHSGPPGQGKRRKLQ